MSDPFHPEQRQEERKNTAQKVLAVADVIYELLKAILSVFGRRSTDRQ